MKYKKIDMAHLHLHSSYSELDAISKIPDIVRLDPIHLFISEFNSFIDVTGSGHGGPSSEPLTGVRITNGRYVFDGTVCTVASFQVILKVARKAPGGVRCPTAGKYFTKPLVSGVSMVTAKASTILAVGE